MNTTPGAEKYFRYASWPSGANALSDRTTLVEKASRREPFGICPSCEAMYEIRAVGYRPGIQPRWHRHCASCGDAGSFTPSDAQLSQWQEDARDAMVRHARRHDPLLGDRRAWSLSPVAEGQGCDPEAHRRSSECASWLELFTADGWTPAGVAASSPEAQLWMVEPDAHPDVAY